MQIVGEKILEECLDGVVIKEIEVDEAVSRMHIQSFAAGHHLEYFAFGRPFYRIKVPKRFLLKGIEEAQTFQVVFTNYTVDDNAYLRRLITTSSASEETHD